MIAEANFPVVSGNIIIADGSPLAGRIQPRAVIEKDGERIAILGVTTPDTEFLSSPGPDVSFQDEIEYLKGAVADMQADGVSKILLLSHVGYNRDQEIAAAVDGISAIIGGHSHTRMSNIEEGAVEYATLVTSPSGRAVPIVQAFAFSRYLGALQLDFADDGAVVAANGDTVLLDASFAPAEDIEALIAPLAEPIERLVRASVAELAAPIDGDRENCRARECEMGNTVTDAMLAEVADRGITIALAIPAGRCTAKRLQMADARPTATLARSYVLTFLPSPGTRFYTFGNSPARRWSLAALRSMA